LIPSSDYGLPTAQARAGFVIATEGEEGSTIARSSTGEDLRELPAPSDAVKRLNAINGASSVSSSIKISRSPLTPRQLGAIKSYNQLTNCIW
jgi:hypothetical protein